MLQRLTVLIDADIARFSSAIASVSGGLNGLAQQAQKVGSTLAAAISVPLGLVAKKAIDTFTEMDSLRRGLATLEKDAGSFTKRMGELNEAAKLPGLGLSEVTQMDVSLRSAGFSAALSMKSMLAFGNALAIIGKGKNELKGVGSQLQQMAGKTAGFGQDLKIIREYAPQLADSMSRVFGTNNTEAIAKMGLTGRQIIEMLVEDLGKLPKATGGPKNAFENFGDTAKRALDGIGSSIYKGLRLEGFFNGLGAGLDSLMKKFANLPGTTQTLIAAFGLVAVALPPLIAGIGFFTTTVLPALNAGLAATKLAMAAFTGPIGLIVLAVGVAVALIITHWDRIKLALVNTGVWTELKVIVKSALGVITSVFAVFANLFQGDWSAMWEHFTNILKYAWNGIIGIIGTSILAMGGLVAKGLSIIGLGNWSKTVKKEMDAVKSGLNDVRFDIKAPAFNILDGLSFGGQNVKDGSNGVDAKTPKKKKAAKEKSVEVDSTLTVLERIRQHIEEQMQDIRASGGVVGEAIRRQLTTVENQIAKIKGEYKRLDYKPVLDFKQADTKIQSDRVAKFADYAKEKLAEIKRYGSLDWLGEQVGQIQARIASGGLRGITPKADDIAKLAQYNGLMRDANNAVQYAQMLSGQVSTAGMTGGTNVDADAVAKMQAQIKAAKDSINLSTQDLATAMQQGQEKLQAAGVGLLAGIGESIGKGQNPLKAALSAILGIIGDYLIQLGTALLLSSAVLLAASPFTFGITLGPGIGQKIAGGAMIVGGGVVKGLAAKPMAAGGYAMGSTYSLTGEYDGANLHRNGEFVAPLKKGARLMIEEMNAQGGMGGGGGGTLTTRVAGSDLLIVYDRARQQQKTYGGGK